MAKVLIVEDNEDIRRLVATRVKGAGHAVVAVGDAEQALTLVAERGAPEVAVLDISLPGMDGYDLCQELRVRTKQPDLPVIFLTARVNQPDVERGQSLGAVYLTKPVIATALLNAIKESVPPDARGW